MPYSFNSWVEANTRAWRKLPFASVPALQIRCYLYHTIQCWIDRSAVLIAHPWCVTRR